ncbi:MAG: MBOAT family protein [Saccharofermentans sp.]|nr:MBOAT family protein [Saccharofermentans sp.]
MLFNSFGFLLFFPITVIFYFLLPNRSRNVWLLAASYFFYMQWSAVHILLLMFSTVISFVSGILTEKAGNDTKQKQLCVLGSFSINLFVLFVFKYANMLPNVSLNLVAVVGISFYTFQALSYTMDVYRGDIPAEHNFITYALFVSFFPQLVAGPIEKSRDFLPQLKTEHKFDYDNAREGFYLMLWGYFIKLCIADRASVIVNRIFDNVSSYNGLYIVIAAVMFAVQIYCDFAGYSIIALGCAKFMGFKLTENFDAPYLSTTVSDFWRRWHISLTSWFRDYLYIPLGGSRNGTCRKYINIMIVLLVSGLWHGAAINFTVWGGLNGLYQVVENILKLNHKRKTFIGKAVGGFFTFVMVDIAWVFFRAKSCREALVALRNLLSPTVFDHSLTFGIGRRQMVVLILCIFVLIVSDIFKRRGVCFRRKLMSLNPVIRAFLVASFIAFILLVGVWGAGFEQAAFIYFQF